MRQANSNIRPPRSDLCDVLQCLSGRRRFIYNNKNFYCLHSGSLACGNRRNSRSCKSRAQIQTAVAEELEFLHYSLLLRAAMNAFLVRSSCPCSPGGRRRNRCPESSPWLRIACCNICPTSSCTNKLDVRTSLASSLTFLFSPHLDQVRMVLDDMLTTREKGFCPILHTPQY